MPEYLNALRDELIELVGDTWADVVPNGLYRSRELVRIDWDKKAAAGEFPVCVIDLDAQPSSEWGMANRVDAITVRIYRVVHDAESADALIENLEALRTALWPDGATEALTTGQVIEYPQVSDTMETTVNKYFLSTGKPFYAGCVVVQVVAGESPD